MSIHDITLSYLPTYLQNGDNIKSVYEAISNIYEDIFQFFQEILIFMDIDRSQGLGLDKIGSILGEERNGRYDKLYRVALKTKVISNRSSGDIETLNDYGRALFGQFFIGIIEGETSGNLILRYTYTNIEDPVRIFKKAVAGGIKVDTQYQTWVPICGTLNVGVLPLAKKLTTI